MGMFSAVLLNRKKEGNPMANIKFYGRHGFPEFGISDAETCGTSCFMMTLDYFGIEFPKKSKEPVYYRKYKVEKEKGTLGSAIAFALSEKGLYSKIVHSSDNYLDNKDGYYSEELYNHFLSQHMKYIKKGGFFSETGAEIDCETLKKELSEEKILILRTFIDGNADGIHKKVMHWILIYGYENGLFLSCDPGFGKTKFSEKEVSEYMKTPFGTIYIAAGKKEAVLR